MSELDSRGVSAAAKALAARSFYPLSWGHDEYCEEAALIVSAYLAVAGSPADETWRTVHKCPSCSRYFDSPSVCSDGTHTVEQRERVPDDAWPSTAATQGVLLDQIRELHQENERLRAASPADERLREAARAADDALLLIADEAPEDIAADIDSVRAVLKDAVAAGVSAEATPDDGGAVLMGFIREQFGRITVESRRESFMIHVEDASLREPSSEWWTDDLDDLIAALVDYRASLGRVSGGRNGVDTPPPSLRDVPRADPGIEVGGTTHTPPDVAPPPNPYPQGNEHCAWRDGYALGYKAGRAAGQSLPSTGTGWDRGFAAGLAARETNPCPRCGGKGWEPDKPWKGAHRWWITCLVCRNAAGLREPDREPSDDDWERQRDEAPAARDTPDGECRAPHCWSEYGTPCGTCPKEKR